MRHFILIIISCVFSSQIFAFGATTNALQSLASLGTTASSGTSTDGTKKLTKDDKIILKAKPDAASFVGSQGQIRGVYLENALQHIRAHYPVANASDLDLAQAILSR